VLSVSACWVDGLQRGAHTTGVLARGEHVALVDFAHYLCELDACGLDEDETEVCRG
jgi:hypothetical protein